MLRLIITILLLCNIAPVFSKTVQTTQRYYNPYDYNMNYNPYYYSKGLNALERYSMNKVYGRENDLHRIERLEMLAFGAVQYGDIDTRYRQVENAILSRPTYDGYKNTFKNLLGNYLAGQATGVTPSIITQDLTPMYSASYAPQYTNSNITQYSSFPFGRSGYSVYNQNYGTNSSLRVLP